MQMLREVLDERIYRIRVDFLPWARLPRELRQGQYDLVFLAWPGDLIQHGLTPSSPWFVSRLGFYMRAGRAREPGPRLEQLRGERVGIVRDYAYPPQLYSSGLQLELSNSDLQNLRKLAARRFDYAVLERAVGEHLLWQASDLRKPAPLVWQEPAFAELPIHVGVVPGRPHSGPLLQALERGLQAYKRDGRYQRLLQLHQLDGVAEPDKERPAGRPTPGPASTLSPAVPANGPARPR